MAPPTRTDDQILPRSRWVPIGKSYCYLDVEKSQSNPIYKIVVDILKHTNFFRAFTASSIIPSIYIQQFWDKIRYDRDTVRYICQLDEQWFDLTKDTLKDALQITPVNNNNPFSSPPIPDALINFVNNLGLTGKTSGFERPRALVLQILWGIINRAHIDIPIHSSLCRRKKESGTAYSGKEESLSHCDPQVLGSDPDSPTPKPTKATKKSKPSTPKAAPVTKLVAAKASKSTSSQQPKPKPAPAKTQKKKRKLVAKTSNEPSPAKSSKPSKVTKRRKPTSSLSLIDEFVDEGILKREPRFDNEEANMKRAVEESSKSVHDAHREKVSDEQVTLDLLTLQTPKKVSPAEQYIFQRRTATPTEPSSQAESPSIYVELGLIGSDMKSDGEVPPVVKIRAQD
nr:hypothetical protein [Tanacetum cinerariifolium]